ncbi:MAG: acyl-CoA dehydrogenase family protein [Burkholderiaceae bacterium]
MSTTHHPFIGEKFFTPEHHLFRDMAHRFVQKEILPYRLEWEAAGTVPREVWRKAGDAGLLCCDMPEQYGGAGGDFLYNVIVTEAMASAGGGGPLIAGHVDTAVPYLLHYGSDTLKTRWLPRAVTGEAIFAIAMTEPHAGSDLKAMRTRAVRDGDDYLITGQKVYITNAQQAHAIVVACQTGEPGTSPKISLFLVESDRAGVTRGPLMKKIGRRAQDTLELFFDQVRVPHENLIGQLDAGLGYLMHVLEQERLSSAIRSMSMTNLALMWTLDFTRDRKAFGSRIADFQHTQFELADMWSQARVMQAYVEACIARQMSGELNGMEAAAVKLRASELEGTTMDRCVQLFGGAGYMWESPIARAYADARVNRISAGSNPILKLIIGRGLVGREKDGPSRV